MKIEHMQRMLNNKAWKGQLALGNPAALRRELLHPNLPFRINETARVVVWRHFELSDDGAVFDGMALPRSETRDS
jgi:hypothetical protein